MEEKARVATHSTTEQAGLFARDIRARTLVLTHFSARWGGSPRVVRGGAPLNSAACRR